MHAVGILGLSEKLDNGRNWRFLEENHGHIHWAGGPATHPAMGGHLQIDAGRCSRMESFRVALVLPRAPISGREWV
jgi:hypothetical protein